MPDEISGINLLVTQGGTAIVAQTNATLTSTAELVEAVVKSTNFSVKNSGDQSWTLSHEGQITDDTGKHALSNGNASIGIGSKSLSITSVDTSADTVTVGSTPDGLFAGDEFEITGSTGNDDTYTVESISSDTITVEGSIGDSTADGTVDYAPTLPGVQSITLSLEQELQEAPPGINEAPAWDYLTPLRRDWTIEVEGHYYDPANSPVFSDIHAARDAGNNLPVELDVLGLTFTGDIAADEFEVEAGTDDTATHSFSFGGSDTLTKNGTSETTIGALLDLYFNQTSATVALEHRTNGSVVTGSTKWTGDAYVSTLDIELGRNEYPTISAEYMGDGALDRVTA
jgi:hypothetical protein